MTHETWFQDEQCHFTVLCNPHPRPLSLNAYVYPHLCECRRHRGAEAPGYGYEARLRGLGQPAQAGFADQSRGL